MKCLSAVHLKGQGDVDIAEVYGTGTVLRRAEFYGLTAGTAFDIRHGWDLSKPAHRRRLWATMEQERP